MGNDRGSNASRFSGAADELRRFLAAGPRFLLEREWDPVETGKKCSELHEEIVSAMHRAEIRDFAALLGFVQKRIASYRRETEKTVSSRNDPSAPETKRRTQILEGLLRRLDPRDREALRAYYLEGKAAEVVCRETGMSVPEFRALQARLRAQFHGRPGEERAIG